MNMRKFFVIAAISLAALVVPPVAGAVSGNQPEFKVASVISDHMVLQRGAEAPVWGWAPKGTKVTVEVSADGAKYQAVAGEDGRWETKVKTPVASAPYSLTVSAKGEKAVRIEDVVSGEVWYCAGQSNMEMPVKGFGGQGVEGSAETILSANAFADDIRVYHSSQNKAYEPVEDSPFSWKKADCATTAGTSAVAYLFARRLTVALGVPVGIIVTPWGGSMIEPWMSAEYVDAAVKGEIPDEKYKEIFDRKEVDGWAPRQVATMFNARVYPVSGYAVKGFLWYQGCSNLDDLYYDRLQASMVRCWRDAWGDTADKIPFMFATIAPYAYGDPSSFRRGYFVENQIRSLSMIPNSYAAVTESYGDKGCIHPGKKAEVADQFALLAMEKVYGMASGMGSGFPYPDEVEFPASSSVKEGNVSHSGVEFKVTRKDKEKNEIRVHFGNAPEGLGHYSDYGAKVGGFEVAGPDKVFHPVETVVAFNDVYVNCEGVENPVALRYAFRNYPEDAGLRTTAGVPVPCFRTDDWPKE